MVHGQTGTAEQVEDTLVVLVANETPHVGKSCRVGHVDGDGVAVTKRNVWYKLVKGGPASGG